MQLEDSLYYGIQTERARQNFAISGLETGRYGIFIWSLAAIKKAAAQANCQVGALDGEIAQAIEQAA